MIYLRLFWEFCKTGLFAIGGGMATVPFLQAISAKTGWFTTGELADMIAVSESTPGPIGVNMATYVGYVTGCEEYGVAGGILGAICSTLGLIFPSIIIILLVAFFLQRFRESKAVDAALYGLRPASVALISAAGINILLIAIFRVDSIYKLTEAKVSWEPLALAALLVVLTRYVKKLKGIHPIWFIAFSAVVGIVLQMA